MYVYVAENRRNTWYIGVRHINYGIGKYDQYAAHDVPSCGPWILGPQEGNHRRHGKKTIRRFLFIYYASVQYFSFFSINPSTLIPTSLIAIPLVYISSNSSFAILNISLVFDVASFNFL